MATYSFSATNLSPSLTQDLIGWDCGSGRRLRLRKIQVSANGNVSGTNDIALVRTSGGSGLGGGSNFFEFEPDSPTGAGSGGSYWITETTPPTVIDTLFSFPVNSDGGEYLWENTPSGDLDDGEGTVALRSQNRMGLRPLVFDPTVTFNVTIILESY